VTRQGAGPIFIVCCDQILTYFSVVTGQRPGPTVSLYIVLVDFDWILIYFCCDGKALVLLYLYIYCPGLVAIGYYSILVLL
jgi:hypothetical protein